VHLVGFIIKKLVWSLGYRLDYRGIAQFRQGRPICSNRQWGLPNLLSSGCWSKSVGAWGWPLASI